MGVMKSTDTKLKIAIQKSGRLFDDSIKLLHDCGLEFEDTKNSRRLKVPVRNLPVEILFVRDDDIAKYVDDGVAHLGIVGENIVRESELNINTERKLGFAKCSMCIAIPKGSEIHNVQDLNNKRVATTYPNSLTQYFSSLNISAKIINVSGSVELSTQIGLADAIYDIVSSGSTLAVNGLVKLVNVFESEALLISKKDLPPDVMKISSTLLFRVDSVLKARNSKYIVLNAPEESLEEILKLLPGLKSPSVMPLATKGWVAVHTVVREDEFWEKVELLKGAGAEGILITNIEKMVA